MTFAVAVRSTPHLGAAALRPGLQGLEAVDRPRIRCSNPKRLCGSIGLDAAMKEAEPDAPRWDYGVCHSQHVEVVHWIEVHPSAHIQEVQAKFDWLKAWLERVGNPMNKLSRRFVWISSGRMTLTQRSPQLRRLAAQGLQPCARIYKID